MKCALSVTLIRAETFPMKKVPLFPILVTTNSPKKQQIIKQGKIKNGPVHAQNIYTGLTMYKCKV